MKTCTYCGKEYPDDATQCAIDGYALSDGPDEPTATSPPPRSVANQIEERAERVWTDRQLLIFELVLICVIAEGGSIISSIYEFSNHIIGRSASSGTPVSILTTSVRQISSLALLWYVLRRRSKKFSDIGFFNCTSWDLVWSLVIYAGHILLSCGFYLLFKSLGLNTTPFRGVLSTANPSVIWIIPVAFVFLDAFFEELIARAYLMTEVFNLTGKVLPAIIISTLFQSSYHLYQGGPAALVHGCMFMIYSIIYAKTGRIGPIILTHIYWDLFGVAWLFPHS